MSTPGGLSKESQYEALVSKLSEDIASNVPGHQFSSKLKLTAITVLNKGGNRAPAAGRWDKEAENAKAALSANNPNGAEFLQKCEEAKAAGIPRLEEFLVMLSSLTKQPEICAALSKDPPPLQHAVSASAAVSSPSFQFQLDKSAAGATPTPARQLSRLGSTPTMTIPAPGTVTPVKSDPPTPPAPKFATPGRHYPPEREPLRQRSTISVEAQAGQQLNGAGATPATPAVPTKPAVAVENGNPASVAQRAMNSQYLNPVFGQDEMSTPRSKEYTPSLSAAIRAHSPPETSAADAPSASSVQQVGSLFTSRTMPALGEEASSMPRLPDWTTSRPHLDGEFLWQGIQGGASSSGQQDLSGYTAPMQERLAMTDILYAFMGLDGSCVRARPAGEDAARRIAFAVDSHLDHSLQELLSRMLPICEYVTIIERFVETRSAYAWGLVAQACAAGMRAFLQDWKLMVTQLEHQLRIGRLTLQALWFYCQPPLSALQLVASIAAEAAAKLLRGSALLDLLHARAGAVSGDAAARRIGEGLLRAAAAPYFRALEQWMCEGVLNDPYGEFMVQENKSVGKASLSPSKESAYWLQRYSLRPRTDATGEPTLDPAGSPVHDVPVFLEASKTAILTTGKYLNAIRECGRPVQRPLPAGVHIEFDAAERYVARLREAHAAASGALLQLMLHSAGLPGLLEALKAYFLGSRGDLLLTFLGSAEEELQRPLGDISMPRLQALLDIAVRASSASGDPHSEELRCVLDERTLLNMVSEVYGHKEDASGTPHRSTPIKVALRTPGGGERGNVRSRSGREAFSLALKVEWPLTVVVSQQAMMQYQLIFRHLFQLKFVERQLNALWRVYQTTRGLYRWPSEALKRAYGLCGQMQHFFRQYLLYVTFEVLEPLSRALQQAIRTAANLDEVVVAHKDFLRRVMKGCLLLRKVKLLVNLMDLRGAAAQFAKLSERLRVGAEELSLEPAGPRKPEHVARRDRAMAVAAAVRSAVEAPEFERGIQELTSAFNAKLKDFILGLRDIHTAAQADRGESREELDSLLNLIERLDFNDYFADKPDFRALLARPL